MAKKEFISGHHIQLVHGGETYFQALVELINESKATLHLQVYIFDLDETGQLVMQALENAAKRGVQVFLVVDGFGSMSLGKNFWEQMKLKGIAFRFFSPLPFPGILQAGRRLHHKVCVVDQSTVLVGGINVSDKYRGSKDQLPWLDFALRAEGAVAAEIYQVCDRIFNKKFVVKMKHRKAPKQGKELSEGVLVRMTQNDWIRGKNEISAAYKFMLGNAQKEIIIVASYFIPSRRLLKILVRAALRGRKVSVILSKNSDVPFIKAATQFLYSKLLRSNVKIFEYTETVMHAKVCVVDQRWVSIGSLNLNHLSELLSLEMNLEVLHPDFGHALSEELQELMQQHCTEINATDFEKAMTWYQRIKSWLAYKLIAWSMRLLSLLSKKSTLD